MIKSLAKIALCFFALSVFAQDKQLPHFIKDSLDGYIVKGMEDWQIPGLAVAVVKDGKTIFMKGFGVQSLETKKPIDENTLFRIGSITKSFTGTAASLLNEEKVIDLYDKVTKWIPNFKLKDSFITKEVNITDLLTHRIGFTSYKGDLISYLSDFSFEDVMERMALLEIDNTFRGSYGYSNSAYATVGEIIQRASGKSWKKTVKDRILIPLEMDRTFMTLEEVKDVNNIASPYTVLNGEIRKVDFVAEEYLAPAGTMFSSVKDMNKWLFLQLNDGSFKNKQIIPKIAIRRTRNPYNIQGFNQRDNTKTHFFGYGLGYFVRDIYGVLTYQHSGGITGFSTNHIIIPEKKLAIAILTNNDTNYFYIDLMHVLIDAFFDKPFEDYSSQSFKNNEETILKDKRELDSLKGLVKKNLKPNISINNFLGTYQNEAYGKVELIKESNTLKLKLLNQKEVTGVLKYIDDNKFLCMFSQYEFGTVVIPFELNGASVIGFKLLLENIEDEGYTFLKDKE